MNSSAVRVHSLMSVNPDVDDGTFHLDVRFKSHSLALVATSAREWRFPIRLMRMGHSLDAFVNTAGSFWWSGLCTKSKSFHSRLSSLI